MGKGQKSTWIEDVTLGLDEQHRKFTTTRALRYVYE
jgi:hypothetical protein